MIAELISVVFNQYPVIDMPHTDPEKRREWARRYYHEKQKHDPEFVRKNRERNRKWASENKEKKREQSKRKYQRNKLNPEWVKEHREKHRNWERKRKTELRLKTITLYGGKCACCGETEYGFLTMDHIEGRNKEHKGWSNDKMYQDMLSQNNPAKFQVLCYNCNLGRAQNNGICPHLEPGGTVDTDGGK